MNDLSEDICRDGKIRVAVIVDQKDNVVDGYYRLVAAKNLGFPLDVIPVQVERFASPEEAEKFATSRNSVRRRLSREEQLKRKEELAATVERLKYPENKNEQQPRSTPAKAGQSMADKKKQIAAGIVLTVELYNQGYKLDEIAEKIGLTRHGVAKYLERARNGESKVKVATGGEWRRLHRAKRLRDAKEHAKQLSASLSKQMKYKRSAPARQPDKKTVAIAFYTKLRDLVHGAANEHPELRAELMPFAGTITGKLKAWEDVKDKPPAP
jgi:predicted transcriptional regulator